ncbi:hypothetical protein [uncultured Maricaulis sp.]|uniref:hypothetical protein n=1 Tax=uncultured Maricaulis sp. TaxID=174710 RepID=UPI0030D880EE|tara:strand:- start:100902 stop:101303 length:402 start_codon:yes stop_codon:yes gene_type:complete
MRQFLLAIVLIAMPVAAFSGFMIWQAKASHTVDAPAANLGDLSAFRIIVTDVQALAAGGDLAAAKTRIRDFELAWDDNETGLKPINPAEWHAIDDAADAALSALRVSAPEPVRVNETLSALKTSLQNRAPVTP